MKYSEYESINRDILDIDSELCLTAKIGTPWVETLILFLENSGYSESSSKLFIDIASDFEEISDKSKVIYNGHFCACRLPSRDEVKTAYALRSSNNTIRKKIESRLNEDACNFANGLSRESHEEILKMLDFEISSPANFYYLMGYPIVDNRDKTSMFGRTSNNELILMQRVGSDDVVFVESNLGKLYGNDNLLDLSNMFGR